MRPTPRRRRVRVIPFVSTALFALCLSACAGGEEKKKPAPPLVGAAAPVQHVFADRIEAVGTARANEQVTISSSVTERVERLLFDDGMIVRRGQLLAVLTQGQEQAALEGAMAAERQAQSQLARIQDLNARGFATHALYEQQLAAAAGARAAAAEARANIGDRMIRAPFSGYASLRTLSEGMVVNAGTPLVTISDLSRIKLDFTVPETRMSALRVGQRIEATAPAFPGRAFEGRISSIDPVIDPSSRAVLVRAILPNGGALIKPGMLMNVRVEVTRRTAAGVPELAVLAEGEQRYVFVAMPDSTAKRVAVRTGLRDNGLIEVEGIPSGFRVVNDGVVKVSDGGRIRLADANEKPAAGPKS